MNVFFDANSTGIGPVSPIRPDMVRPNRPEIGVHAGTLPVVEAW